MSPLKLAPEVEARLQALEIKVEALITAAAILRSITEPTLNEAARQQWAAVPPQPPPPVLPPESPDPSWEPILHVRNTRLEGQTPSQVHSACFQPAQYIVRKVDPNEKGDLQLLRVRGLGEAHWHAPRQGEASLCSSCFQPIQSTTAENLDWARAFLPTPEPPPQANPRRNNAANRTRRKRSAPESSVRVQPTPGPDTASTGVTPPQGTLVAAPESISPDALPKQYTPEAAADALEEISRLAKEMGHA